MKREQISKLREKNEQRRSQVQDLQMRLQFHQAQLPERQIMNLNLSQYVGELFKQFVSLKRVISRNQEQGEEDFYPAENPDKYQIPFILLKFLPNSSINIMKDKLGRNLEVESMKPFDLMNENHLLAGMGMTRL